MKKVLFTLIMAMMVVPFMNAKEIVTQDEKRLPTEARDFISRHFPESKVSYIKIDDEFILYKQYEVVLTNGVEIEFDSKGNWKEVDTKRQEVPANIIPLKIREYTNNNFANNFITKIERDRYGYEVELNNDLSLKFDKNGTFKRLDD
ncbi:PepSY-like domain-containing protein [Bacteroides sp. 519]|uniref:PepSY-like domain-containing protein n=1 Tax=Bacteroides sp. 519 TaxID=2302937 RepID=UPI0013D3313A|nr:PepSY-like domain-containing protein [Bacteroides sp. 519]NDV58128.1 hypothetical protein [Bacteroides sp. 519]